MSIQVPAGRKAELRSGTCFTRTTAFMAAVSPRIIVPAALGGKMRRGILAASLILLLAGGLGVLAVIGKPGVVRRPDAAARPTLLVPDFANRTGRGELVPFSPGAGRGGPGRGSKATPVASSWSRPDGFVRCSDRRSATSAFFGSPHAWEPTMCSWAASSQGAGCRSGRVPRGRRPRISALAGAGKCGWMVLLVRDSDPPHVFAERFPLGDPSSDPAVRARRARAVADRIALALRRP